MSDGERRVVIVKKARRKKSGGHGGSWKVAYADFVTAMMAFFLVMWIMGMDEGVKEVVEGYFSNPVGFRQSFSGGKNMMSAGNAPINMSPQSHMLMTRAEQSREFVEAAEEIVEQLRAAAMTESLAASFEVTVTAAGLRIELMERAGGDSFFEVGSADLKGSLRSALAVVVDELTRLPNKVVIEGHTDGRGFQRPGYTNWELSGDRANATRRALLGLGFPTQRIGEIRGYADRQLKLPTEPFAPENRRISILLPYQDDLIRPVTPDVSAGGGGGDVPPGGSESDPS
ncbi:MAG: flagellar motor protein MotB [Longimicrobiales bacterium]